jgi:hypothetical protein
MSTRKDLGLYTATRSERPNLISLRRSKDETRKGLQIRRERLANSSVEAYQLLAAYCVQRIPSAPEVDSF